MNILDQRFIPLLEKLKSKGIEIHTRSTFLQGLLLMKSIPKYFEEINNKINSIPYPRLAYALAFVKEQKNVDKMVLGVTTLQDLEEIYSAYNAKINNVDYSQYVVSNEKYINPSLWKIN